MLRVLREFSKVRGLQRYINSLQSEQRGVPMQASSSTLVAALVLNSVHPPPRFPARFCPSALSLFSVFFLLNRLMSIFSLTTNYFTFFAFLIYFALASSVSSFIVGFLWMPILFFPPSLTLEAAATCFSLFCSDCFCQLPTLLLFLLLAATFLFFFYSTCQEHLEWMAFSLALEMPTLLAFLLPFAAPSPASWPFSFLHSIP